MKGWTASGRVATWALASLAFLLAGCGGSGGAQRLAPHAVQAASEEAMEDLRAGHYEALNRRLVASLQARDNSAEFRRMARFIPPDGEVASHVAGYYFQTGAGGTQYDITYEYQFAHTWVVAHYLWVPGSDGLELASFHVNSQADSLEELQAFSFRDLTGAKVLVLALGVCAVGLSLYALVKCIRTPGLKRKWLWLLFILVGMGGFEVNWSTGKWAVALLQAHFLSFSAFASQGQPWVVAASLPVGAVVFLDYCRKRKAASPAGA
jgi:hypothetical protein